MKEKGEVDKAYADEEQYEEVLSQAWGAIG
jgi:hypothetical protein